MAGTENQMVDRYLSQLSKIIDDVEVAYDLQGKAGDTVRYCDLGMKELMTVLNTRVSTTSKEDIAVINANAARAVVPLLYVSDRLKYYNKKRLDYSKYPGMLQVSKVLLTFTRLSNISEQSLNDLNMIIEVLVQIDEQYMNYRGGLGYRYLRAFIIMALYGNYFNAAVIARFILDQFLVVKGD